MRRLGKTLLASSLAAVMSMGMMSGAAFAEESGDKIDVLNQEETMPLKIAVLTGFTQSDSEVEKWLEEKYNIDIELLVLPGWSDAQSKISLLMADEEQRPDIIWFWSMDSEFVKWVDAGLLVDVSEYQKKYTNIVDYYNKMDEKTLFYESSEDGMYRIPGDVAEPCCETLLIRKDWLDNLGLDIPETYDDLLNVIRAFTFDDPDGNGVDDTYGLGGDGYDFRTFWPFIQAYGGSHYDRFCINEDGIIGYGPAQENTKKWVKDVADLYAEGCITPNIVTDTDRDEEMAKGGFGVTYGWISWMTTKGSSATMNAFYSANPDAEWIPIDMVVGESGDAEEDPATSSAWAHLAITKNCSDPERAYAIWDDMCSEENYIRRRFGVEGEHWVREDDGSVTILISNESSENEEQNIGLKLFDNMVNRKDECNLDNTPEMIELFNKAAENSRNYADSLVEWKDLTIFTEWQDCATDIEGEKNEFLWGVISGNRSIDEWDTYIETLNAYGLDRVLEQANELYPEQKAAMDAYLAK